MNIAKNKVNCAVVQPLLLVLGALLVSACATTGQTGQAGQSGANGKVAPFYRNKCAALSQWVEPLQWRYPNSNPGRWMEPTAGYNMRFLFTDPYFVPVFGAKIDELSDRQIRSIHNALTATRRSACKSETYLLSLYPGIFLARVFDPRFPNAKFSMSYVTQHAKAAREINSDTLSKDNIKLVQQRIRKKGFLVGAIDGDVGPNTTEGIIAYKKSVNMSPYDGDLSPELLARLDAYYVPAPKKVIAKPSTRATPSSSNSYSQRNNTSTSNSNVVRDSVPQESVKISMDKLSNGTSINLTRNNRAYFAGVSGALLEYCPATGTIAERSKLASLIFAEQMGPLIDLYSSNNLGQAFNRGAGNAALLNTGFVVGRQLGCGRTASTVMSALAESL